MKGCDRIVNRYEKKVFVIKQKTTEKSRSITQSRCKKFLRSKMSISYPRLYNLSPINPYIINFVRININIYIVFAQIKFLQNHYLQQVLYNEFSHSILEFDYSKKDFP